MTEPAAIRLTRTLPHSPAEVWTALTDPARHATWWAAGDIRPVVGHRFTLDMGKWGMQPCEVLAAEAASRLSYAFAPGVLNTVITWSLAPEGDGTRLSLEHAGFDLETPAGKTAFEGIRAGWPMVIDRLAAMLAA
ncbi:SRPBCC family protein [Ralstonia nicotianae]